MLRLPCAPVRRAVLSGMMVAVFTLAPGGALAASDTSATAANGLGQAWPQTKDLSSVPGWHVYVLTRAGV